MVTGFLAESLLSGLEMISGEIFYWMRRTPSSFDTQVIVRGQIPVVMSSPVINICAISLTVVVRCKVLSFIPKIFTSSMLFTVTGTVTFERRVLLGCK